MTPTSLRPRLANAYRASRDASIALMPEGDLPGALIIGAQRAGTTSLFQALAEHPDIRPSRMKEVHYADRNWHRGSSWYRRAFQSGDGIGLEATPNYLFHPRAAQRMATTAPHAKIIAVLRNPVERAISHHAYETERGHETRDFRTAIVAEDDLKKHWRAAVRQGKWSKRIERQSYLRRGLYAEHLFRWQTHFSAHQILVLEDVDFRKAPEMTFDKILDFLDLPPAKMAFPRLNSARSRAAVCPPNLMDRFVEDGRRLEAACGRRFSWLH